MKNFFLILWVFVFSIDHISADDGTSSSLYPYDVEEEGYTFSTEWLMILGGMTAILPCSLVCLSLVLNCCTDLELMKIDQLTAQAGRLP